jgi:betaine-homocysteine S-methyltransferase
MKKKGILERLKEGPVLGDGGYLLELEKRGWVRAGPFTPEVALLYPNALRELHVEFREAGAEVLQALTFYASRDKLATVGLENRLEELNRSAVRVAREVAGNQCLVAGNISLTWMYEPGSPSAADRVRKTFDEQLAVQVDEGVDFIIGETFSWLGEALIAVERAKKTGLPAMVTMAPTQPDRTRDGHEYAEACRILAAEGAQVVGLNCDRGPATMLPLLGEIRAACDGYIAALPVPYRTTEAEPTFQSLTDQACELIPNGRPFPTALDPFLANRYEMGAFTTAAAALGVNYFGICCGCAPHHVRAMAEALGRTPPASRFSADMSRHAYYGTSERISRHYQEFAKEL